MPFNVPLCCRKATRTIQHLLHNFYKREITYKFDKKTSVFVGDGIPYGNLLQLMANFLHLLTIFKHVATFGTQVAPKSE